MRLTCSSQKKKIEQRRMNQMISPTSFLWSPYYPNRYYFEVSYPAWGTVTHISPNCVISAATTEGEHTAADASKAVLGACDGSVLITPPPTPY